MKRHELLGLEQKRKITFMITILFMRQHLVSDTELGGTNVLIWAQMPYALNALVP